MTQGDFTEQDRFEPVYCRRCRQHVPRALLDPNGLCLPCAPLARAEQITALAAAEEAKRQQEAARQARVEEATTRLGEALRGETRVNGICPTCGGQEIVQFTTGGDSHAPELACCLGCLCLWPLMVVAPLLSRGQKQYHRQCLSCGHQWLC